MTSPTTWKTDFENDLAMPVYAQVLMEHDFQDPTLPDQLALTIASTPVKLITLSVANIKGGEMGPAVSLLVEPRLKFNERHYLPKMPIPLRKSELKARAKSK